MESVNFRGNNFSCQFEPQEKKQQSDVSVKKNYKEIKGPEKCYNPAFCGIFKQEGYDPSKDLRVSCKDVTMAPFKDYIVGTDQEFVGKNKLRFKKDKDGYLHAMNVSPQFGDYPVLKQNTQHIGRTSGTALLPGVRYASKDALNLRAGEYEFKMEDYPAIVNLEEGEKLVIGSTDTADITPDGSKGKLAGKQWQIEKKAGYFVITDLTEEGKSVCYSKGREFYTDFNPNFVCEEPVADFSNAKEKITLKPYTPVIVSPDSSLVLGEDCVLNLKDKRLLEKFKFKDTVIVGSGKLSADLRIRDSYSDVIGQHVAVKKHGDKFIVCDLFSQSGTEVLPEKAGKIFLNGADNIDFKQGNTGDCYLLSPLYALSRTEKGAEILENMVRKDDEGNFLVKFHNSPTFVIRPDDLADETYRGKTKPGVEAEPAICAIEKAYARFVKPVSVLGGKSDRPMFSKIDEGGFSQRAYLALTGIKSDESDPGKYSVKELTEKLVQAKKSGCAIACGTKRTKNKKDVFVDPDKQIYGSHCYAVGEVLPEARVIVLINPHDTKERVPVTVEDFQKYFNSLDILKLS